jgi:hypothetical protein
VCAKGIGKNQIKARAKAAFGAENHAVTGNHQGHTVAGAGVGHGPDGLRLSDRGRHLRSDRAVVEFAAAASVARLHGCQVLFRRES